MVYENASTIAGLDFVHMCHICICMERNEESNREIGRQREWEININGLFYFNEYGCGCHNTHSVPAHSLLLLLVLSPPPAFTALSYIGIVHSLSKEQTLAACRSIALCIWNILERNDLEKKTNEFHAVRGDGGCWDVECSQLKWTNGHSVCYWWRCAVCYSGWWCQRWPGSSIISAIQKPIPSSQ